MEEDDKISDLLQDVEMFLVITLREEQVSAECSAHRSRLIDKIERCRQEYPQLQMRESYRIKGDASMSRGESDDISDGQSIDDCEEESIYETVEVPAAESAAGAGKVGSAAESAGSAGDSQSVHSGSTSSINRVVPAGTVVAVPAVSALHTVERYARSVDVPCQSVIGSALIHGYLEKKKDNKVSLRRFSRRYCVLSADRRLYMYKDKVPEAAQGARECVDMRQYEARETSLNLYASTSTITGQSLLAAATGGSLSQGTGSKYRELSFDLVCPGRKTITMTAPNRGELQKWLEKLREDPYKPEEVPLARSAEDVQETGAETKTEDRGGNEGVESHDVSTSDINYADTVDTSAGSDTEGDVAEGNNQEGDDRSRDGDAIEEEPLYSEAETDDVGGSGGGNTDEDCRLLKQTSTAPPAPVIPLTGGSEGAGLQSSDSVAGSGSPAVSTKPGTGGERGEGGSSSSSGHGSADESASGEESEPEIDYQNWYIGKWACEADSDDELQFERGDLIHVISKEYDKYGWWIGKLNGHGRIGLVPKNYLMEAYELIC